MDVNKQSNSVMLYDVPLGVADTIVVLVERRFNVVDTERRFRFVSVRVELDSCQIVQHEGRAISVEKIAKFIPDTNGQFVGREIVVRCCFASME
jgi:hypothetical protein